jgi:hypothetical protein
MLEARAFVAEIESARKILEEKAVFKGEYVCRDAIYISIDSSKSLADEFLRLRVNEKNIWSEKDVIVAIKQTEKKEVGKNSVIPLRKEFDTEEEARNYIEKNLLDKFKFDFKFTRTGWQYDLAGGQVDLERVEDLSNCYTIEVKSPTEEGLKKLLNMFQIDSVITGPSVVEVKKLLNEGMMKV